MELAVDMPTGTEYKSDEAGRFIYALLRTAIDINLQDYVAHRTLLGFGRRVGITTINSIRNKAENLNYMDLFYNPLPQNVVFNGREVRALEQARAQCASVSSWSPEDPIFEHKQAIADIVQERFGPEEGAKWLRWVQPLPDETHLTEVTEILAAETSDQRESILYDVYSRLQLPIPDEGLLPQQIRVMTMHGAKGLNADVVIIPGLEDDILPGEHRSRTAGQVQEAARLLYVSITRARHAVILTYARSRTKYGSREYDRVPSRYCDHLDGAFVERDAGLDEEETQEIINIRNQYQSNMERRREMLPPTV